MQIIGRNPTPDKYSIKDIYLGCERISEDDPIHSYLVVELEPQAYMRQRFAEGQSHEKKKNPCKLRIALSELQQMEQTLRRELQDCYRFLDERDLLATWLKKRGEKKQEVPAKAS